MARGKGRKPVKLLQNGKYTSPEQNPGNGLEEQPSISERERARRLLWGSKPRTSRRKLLSSPRPSTTNTRKVLSNPRPPTTTTPNLLSEPRSRNNEEFSRPLYSPSSPSFPGWATSTLPRNLQARHLLQEALIPSPLTDEDWDCLKPDLKAAWIDIIDHTSSETRALYNYIRENLSDIDDFIFGGEKEFPSKCKSGLLCHLVKEDTSADNYLYTDSDDEGDVPITMFRKRWIEGDFLLPLDPQAGSGKLHTAAEGRALSSASSSLELRRLSLDNEDRYGFFITNGSLAPLFVNGISVGMNMVVGPLPDFAVIEAEDVVFFWWCTVQGVTYIPKDLPTVQLSPGSGYGRSKRTFEVIEGYENLNDEVPAAKRLKFDEVEHTGTPSSIGRSIRGNGKRTNDIQAAKETANQNETAAIGGQTAPRTDKDQPRTELNQSTKGSDGSSPSRKRGLSESAGHHSGGGTSGPEGSTLGSGGCPSGAGGDRPAPGGDPPAPGADPPGSGERPPTPGEDPSSSPASWEAILDAGMQRHSEHFGQQSAEMQRHCTRIRNPTDMMDESVVLAIASLWDGLRRAGTMFGFGTADTFRCNRSEGTVAPGTTAVSGPYPLIIPLLINKADVHTPPPPKYAKGATRGKKIEKPKGKRKGKGRETKETSQHVGGIGHFVFAVAERRNNDIVETTVKDSAPGHVSREDLFEATHGLVTLSGWMGVDPQGNPVPAEPSFPVESYPEVPRQYCGNTCGLYVILNAWACMLGIPTRPQRVFVRAHPHRRFHTLALQLINLALAGFMDSSTIQAFLNVLGYAVQQDVNDLTVHVVRADAQRMDQRILADRVMEQRDLDRALALEPPPTEAQITQVTDLGTSREMAIRQLKLARNHAQTVAENLTAARHSPGPGDIFQPHEEDISRLMMIGGFSHDSVNQELIRTRGHLDTALSNLFDQHQTGNSPTRTGTDSTPHKAGNQTRPPSTGVQHSYDEVDIGRLMSYRDISLNTVLRQLDRAGGDVRKAEEKIRDLSNALSSNSGSAQSHHSALNDPGPSNPDTELPYTDKDVDGVMATKQEAQERIAEERENFAVNVQRSRRDMIKNLTQDEAPSAATNPQEDPASNPSGKPAISERPPSHTYTLTSPISTTITTAQVNPPAIDLPESSTPHEHLTPFVNTEQPPAPATQPPQLRREMVFPEEDVNTLTSVGYSRAEAVFALEMGGGDLARAVDYLYAQHPEE